MRSAALKTGFALLVSILAIAYPCLPVVAQTEEEIKILSMFYREKELVVTPTRHPKPISQVAENITVVTAKEIEEMNAHTVAEVLNRVTGLFVNFNQDFGATSLLVIQGSEQRHVLVLLDGMPWNFLSDGAAETNAIPVGIIERIEIIKGPASSTWGSSLGGVINILTKPVGETQRPTGALRASYGERDTQDYRGQVAGKAGPMGYYLYAGWQESDGLRFSRYFDSYSLYSKLQVPISENVEAGLTLGYSQPNVKLGDLPSQDITQTGSIRTFHATASLDAYLSRELSLSLSFHGLSQKSVIMNDVLGIAMIGAAGELFLHTIFDEETKGGRGQLVWDRGAHTAVLGVDFDHGTLEQTLQAGPLLQFMGVPASSTTSPRIDRWAVYGNDTIVIDRLSVTPGIRYDRNSITGSFISPSLGLTYRVDDHSILRASVARGFTIPPLSSTSGGGLFIDPNPALEPEEIWSYQAGAESGIFKYFWVKATFFRHDLKKALKKELFAAGPPTFNDLIVNDGEIRRRGVELEAETLPVHNVSLWAGYAYVDIEPANETGSDWAYSWNIGVRYDDRKSFRAQVFGHYIWWNADPRFNGSYDDFIWDLNLNKKVYSRKTTSTEVFFTAHNLSNAAQYPIGDNKNPRRWVEAGIQVKF